MNILEKLKNIFRNTKPDYYYDYYVQNERDLKQIEYTRMMTWLMSAR